MDMTMKKLQVTLKKSVIGSSKSQRATVSGLGLRKINHVVEHESTPQILGMIKKVEHLLEVEQIK